VSEPWPSPRELFGKKLVALGVEHDRAVAVLDQAPGDPRLRDRLPRAGDARYEHVRAGTDLDAYKPVVFILAHHQLAVR